MDSTMDSRIKLLNRLKMQLSGYVYTGHKRKDGWRGELPHYQFHCLVHGLVENYPSGYEQRLECPLCLAERRGRRLKAAAEE
jgi:hypothetical protein